MRTFGASAPLKELQKKFGFTAERVAAAARQVDSERPWSDRDVNRGVARWGVKASHTWPESRTMKILCRRHRRHVDQDPGNGARRADQDSIGSAPDAEADGQQGEGSDRRLGVQRLCRSATRGR